MENTWVALVKSFPKKVFSFYSNDYGDWLWIKSQDFAVFAWADAESS